jgi:hypothetical protein
VRFSGSIRLGPGRLVAQDPRFSPWGRWVDSAPRRGARPRRAIQRLRGPASASLRWNPPRVQILQGRWVFSA